MSLYRVDMPIGYTALHCLLLLRGGVLDHATLNLLLREVCSLSKREVVGLLHRLANGDDGDGGGHSGQHAIEPVTAKEEQHQRQENTQNSRYDPATPGRAWCWKRWRRWS